jgi:hypothetical protein
MSIAAADPVEEVVGCF